jgi:hypothetical protein
MAGKVSQKKKSTKSPVKDSKKTETVSQLKKKVLDLKDALRTTSRENKFLKESLTKIKAPKEKKGFFEKIKNSTTTQKLGGIAGLLGGGATVAFLAKLAKDEIDRRSALQAQVISQPDIVMESMSPATSMRDSLPSPRYQPKQPQQQSIFSRFGGQFAPKQQSNGGSGSIVL